MDKKELNKNETFEKTKELLKLLEGFNYKDCTSIIKTMKNNINYRKNKTLNETLFTYEDLLIG